MKRRGKGQKTAALETAILSALDAFDGPMSSRQVFYQVVSAGAVENNPRECARVLRSVLALRRDGRVPYRRIVDRTRTKHHRPGWDGAADLLEDAAAQYRRNAWADQATVPMIACEKQALEGVFSEAVDTFGVSLWTLRGFASESFAYEWAEEIRALTATGARVVVSYFGDFDPSGLAIEADARARLAGFGAIFDWTRAGLLETDFDAFDLVRLAVKKTDKRAKGFLSKFAHGAELDALPPAELRRRTEVEIKKHIDVERWEAMRRTEALERETLDGIVRSLRSAA